MSEGHVLKTQLSSQLSEPLLIGICVNGALMCHVGVPKLVKHFVAPGGNELKWGSDRNLQNQTAMATKWQHVPS